MSALKVSEIFNLSTLIRNIGPIKKSCCANKILCCVLENDDLVFRYCNSQEVIVKTLKKFNEDNKKIQDICFDDSGTWLVVVCYDNTLHVVPALYICDKSAKFRLIFNAKEIQSFVIPFSPKHDCPNPKTCPNDLETTSPVNLDVSTRTFLPSSGRKSNEAISPSSFYNQFYVETKDDSQNNNAESQNSLSVNQANSRSSTGSTPNDSQVFSSSISSYGCPFPTTVAWWQTLFEHYRAVVGYSDGTICVVALTVNCPLVGSWHLERGAIERLIVCHDNNTDVVTLMITTKFEQWKLLLEQKSTVDPSRSGHDDGSEGSGTKKDEDSWTKTNTEERRDDGMYGKLILLYDLGAKQLGNLKSKYVDKGIKSRVKEKSKEHQSSFTDGSFITPEIVTTISDGPFFIVERSEDRNLLSALQSYSITMDIYPIPIVLTDYFIYLALVEESTTPINDETPQSQSIENVISSQSSQCETEANVKASFGIISRSMASTKSNEDCHFNERALIAHYTFDDDEKIVGIHKIIGPDCEDETTTILDSLNSNSETIVSNYFNLDNDLKQKVFARFSATDDCVLQNQFPKISFESCYIVTTKRVCAIEFIDHPHIVFLRFVDQANWVQCEDFCKIFNLSLPQCIEFAGDVLLKKKKVTKALLTYNIARIPPIKTALKLAMFSCIDALMHLCAMALKNTFLISSQFPMHQNIKYLVDTCHLRHLKYDHLIKEHHNKAALVNTGEMCSDFSYETDEVSSDLQMSNSSQFHLSNLLFLALTERCVRDKNYMPLWNFIVTNSKFHTSLASVVMAQSGLYSTSVLLATIRGSTLDVFSCLVGASEHVLSIGQEWNVFVYNISDEIFRECIMYIRDYAIEYFEVLRKHIGQLDLKNLERLEKQLNPFASTFRPVMSKMLRNKDQGSSEEHGKRFMEFCKYFIETYVMIVMQTQALKLYSDNFLSALNLFNVSISNDQHDVRIQNFSPVSTGFSHAAYVTKGVVFIWGSNGVSCALSRNLISPENAENTSCLPTCLDFFRELDIEVSSVHCGKSHTLFLTNNGLYGMGANQQGQLGIGSILLNALQPQFISAFDGQHISHISAGQYHNAVVADGILYTWGWNVYGQLGHGDVENQSLPKEVEFFKGKQILQVSLGHAHTLVLSKQCKRTELYVFGSNHYGQLGIGHGTHSKSLLKSSVPVLLRLEEEIRLIQTKFFSNLAVSKSNQLYTWGLSPQAIRLSTQAKKKARSNLRDATKRPAVRESEEVSFGKETTVSSAEDDPDLDDVFVEKGMEEHQEKTTEIIPEIKIDLVEETTIPEEEQKESLLEESTDHLFPSLVDGDFQKPITHISSGLYHYAIVDSSGIVYTWGKNLEKQLGREGARKDIPIKYPVPLENFSDCSTVECGSDFTVFVTKDGVVKACGNNNYGQCGREIAPSDTSGIAGKLVRLRISKRLVRIPDGSQCIPTPMEVKFRIPNTTNPSIITSLKNLPTFTEDCIIQSSLSKFKVFTENNSGHTTIDSNLNEFCRDDTPDLIIKALDPNENQQRQEVANNGLDLSDSSTSQVASNRITAENNLKCDYVHFCLYIFHGLYDQDTLINFASRLNFKEYHIRIHQLNYKYIESFKLCISECFNAEKCIKIFEFFTKDSTIVPTYEENLKHFIYEIFKHFISNQMDITLLESYFLSDLDTYLIQLTYVLYFNNNNTTLGKTTFEKFRHLYTNYDQPFNMDNTETIFKKISASFNIRLCQKLIELFDKKT